MQTLTSQLSSTLMQPLFSFNRGMRVEKTLMQTLASQQLSFLFDQGILASFLKNISVCLNKKQIEGALLLIN